MDTAIITPVTSAETATEKKAAAARLWAMLVAMYEAVRAFVRALLGMGTEAVGELKGDAVALTRGARRGVEATGRVVGVGLEGPARVLDATAGAIGSTLGALLPQAPVTPAAVARGAVARDDRREAVGYAPVQASSPAPVPVTTLPGLIKQHAYAALDWKGEKANALPPLDARHAAWIASLSMGERLTLAAAAPATIARHLDATSASERILGVSAVPSPAQHSVARSQIDTAMAILEAMPSRPDLSPRDAFRALGVSIDDEPEEDEPVARFGR